MIEVGPSLSVLHKLYFFRIKIITKNGSGYKTEDTCYIG